MAARPLQQIDIYGQIDSALVLAQQLLFFAVSLLRQQMLVEQPPHLSTLNPLASKYASVPPTTNTRPFPATKTAVRTHAIKKVPPNADECDEEKDTDRKDDIAHEDRVSVLNVRNTLELEPMTASSECDPFDGEELKHNTETTTRRISTQKKKKKATKKKPKKATPPKPASDLTAEKELWVYLLSNAPETLVQKYPDLLEQYRSQYFLGACDGDLSGLKATDLNGKHIIFFERNAQKQRLVVKVLHGS